VDQLDTTAILKDLNREVKTAERISMKVNPPKPERESKRRRKEKRIDEDFIDLSDPSSLYLYDWEQKMTPGIRRPVKKPVAVKSKPPDGEEEEEEEERPEEETVGPEEEDLEQYRFVPPSRLTVSPLRLSLSSSKPGAEGEGATENTRAPEPDETYDLTDRDSVRQLMVSKKAELTSALDDAMADFGDGAEEPPTESGLMIDETKPKKAAKKPLKIRLSVSSQNSESEVRSYRQLEESEEVEGIPSPGTRDAVEGHSPLPPLPLPPLPQLFSLFHNP
jgi:hypothetical protein